MKEIITDYLAGVYSADEALEKMGLEVTDEKILELKLAQRAWDNVEVDEEGPTAAQNAELNTIIQDVENRLK